MTDPIPPRARPPDPGPPARRLLVLACSARKRHDAGNLPAVDRYDGPAFRVLRKFLADAADPPDVLVLSAGYGLIPSAREVPDYDRRLTPGDADALRPGVLLALGEALAGMPCAEVALCLGRDYLRAVAGYADIVPARTTVTLLTGTQGSRLRNLRAWLVAGSTASG